MTQRQLRDIIGYVPQKAVLFSGTVNPTYGTAGGTRPMMKSERAADTAQATKFIQTMPEVMDSPISQGGANVSGGQKQRLSIARALVKKAPIYIFDDSFSALDFKTDATLRKALRENHLKFSRADSRPARRHHNERRPDNRAGQGQDCGARAPTAS